MFSWGTNLLCLREVMSSNLSDVISIHNSRELKGTTLSCSLREKVAFSLSSVTVSYWHWPIIGRLWAHAYRRGHWQTQTVRRAGVEMRGNALFSTPVACVMPSHSIVQNVHLCSLRFSHESNLICRNWTWLNEREVWIK